MSHVVPFLEHLVQKVQSVLVFPEDLLLKLAIERASGLKLRVYFSLFLTILDPRYNRWQQRMKDSQSGF